MYEDFERSLRLIASGDVDHATLLHDRFSLIEADVAFETFLKGGTCKNQSSMSRSSRLSSTGALLLAALFSASQ